MLKSISPDWWVFPHNQQELELCDKCVWVRITHEKCDINLLYNLYGWHFIVAFDGDGTFVGGFNGNPIKYLQQQ